jgi:DNA-directed RNA polymerase specialized sigma24 family protein
MVNSKNAPEQATSFGECFSRHRELLHFLACRLLGSAEVAEVAVQNCFLRTSRNPPRLPCEKEFGSWLLRRLIEEALLLRRDLLRGVGELRDTKPLETR